MGPRDIRGVSIPSAVYVCLHNHSVERMKGLFADFAKLTVVMISEIAKQTFTRREVSSSIGGEVRLKENAFAIVVSSSARLREDEISKPINCQQILEHFSPLQLTPYGKPIPSQIHCTHTLLPV